MERIGLLANIVTIAPDSTSRLFSAARPKVLGGTTNRVPPSVFVNNVVAEGKMYSGTNGRWYSHPRGTWSSTIRRGALPVSVRSSKTKTYSNNRADNAYIPGTVIPGYIIIKPDFPECIAAFGFLWFEDEAVVAGSSPATLRTRSSRN